MILQKLIRKILPTAIEILAWLIIIGAIIFSIFISRSLLFFYEENIYLTILIMLLGLLLGIILDILILGPIAILLDIRKFLKEKKDQKE